MFRGLLVCLHILVNKNKQDNKGPMELMVVTVGAHCTQRPGPLWYWRGGQPIKARISKCWCLPHSILIRMKSSPQSIMRFGLLAYHSLLDHHNSHSSLVHFLYVEQENTYAGSSIDRCPKINNLMDKFLFLLSSSYSLRLGRRTE